jgi:iron complex outermembrane receptor protein
VGNNAFRGALAVSTALSLVTFQAAAQAAPNPATPAVTTQRAASTAPEQVIVTARRREERLQNVPISIKVFSQATLSSRNIQTAEELATNTPSLSADTNFGNQNTTFAIRGFVQDIGTQPSVGTYFADVVSPRGGSNQLPIGDSLNAGSLFDLQNVQVLKGPQGTLFGLNTTGGAVLLVPQKPTSDLNGYLEAGYGNYDAKSVEGVINIPISDKIRLRLGVDHADRDGYETNNSGVGPSHFGDLDYTDFRASLVVDVTDDIENYTIFSYNKSAETGSVQKLVGCNPFSIPGNPIGSFEANAFGTLACEQLAREKGTGFYTVQNPLADPYTNLRTWQAINTTTWHATDDITIKNIASYAQLKDDYQSPIFGTDFNLSDVPVLGQFFPKGTKVFFTDSQPPLGADSANQSTITEELQLQATALDSRLTYQGGIYLELSDPLGTENGAESPTLAGCTDAYTFTCSNPLGEGDVGLTVGRERSKDVGVYSQATYAITEQLKLTGGARYTWDNTSDGNNLISYELPGRNFPALTPVCTNPNAVLPACYSSVTESSRAPTWLLDLDYKPFDTTLLYAKYERGYRAGGVVQSVGPPFDTYGPERVNTYEAGLKQTFLGAVNGTFDVDGFYNDFANQQVQIGFDPRTTGVAPASGIANVGRSRIFGAEIDATITPFPGFTAAVDYTYLNTKITQLTTLQTNAQSLYVVADQAIQGDPLTLSPKNKVTVSGTYVLPLDPDLGKISVGASFIYTDPQLANYADTTATDAAMINGVIVAGPPNGAVRDLAYLQARHLLNLNASWTSIFGSPFDVTAYATNVTGEKYYTFLAGLYSPSLGIETAALGEPTFYGFKVRYNFRPKPKLPPPPPEAASIVPPPAVLPTRTYLVFFDWDRADLTDRARQIVASAAEASTHVQTTRIDVNGYTDLSGTPAYNQKLSVRRAETVQQELVRDGVAPGEISIHGYGESNPLVPTAQGVREPQNRRVEIILM